MTPDQKALKQLLQKRELELQRLIRQMKFDRLNQSIVFKKLERELVNVQVELNGQESDLRNF